MNFSTLNPSAFCKPARSIDPDTYTASANGTSVDCRGFEHALVVIALNTISSSNTGTITIEQSSDDGSSDSFAAISGALYTFTGTDDDAVKAIAVRLHGKERYLRAVYTETATGQSTQISAIFVLMGPQDRSNDQSFSYAASVL